MVEPHFVLLGSDKRPLRKWSVDRPNWLDAFLHYETGGSVAIVPSSIGAFCFDVDSVPKSRSPYDYDFKLIHSINAELRTGTDCHHSTRPPKFHAWIHAPTKPFVKGAPSSLKATQSQLWRCGEVGGEFRYDKGYAKCPNVEYFLAVVEHFQQRRQRPATLEAIDKWLSDHAVEPPSAPRRDDLRPLPTTNKSSVRTHSTLTNGNRHNETRRRLTRSAFLRDWIGAEQAVEDALASGLPRSEVESIWQDAQRYARQHQPADDFKEIEA